MQPKPRLIETWDVLKYEKGKGAVWVDSRLIETWDVLKLKICGYSSELLVGLIETWDVLKFQCQHQRRHDGRD